MEYLAFQNLPTFIIPRYCSKTGTGGDINES
jgi:hypothetical protein